MNEIGDLQTWLVGGYVRDRLIGRASNERDWVVVNATTQQMLDMGFTQVGASFPVFLHPHSKEEYALARSERKSGSGHTGFITDTHAISLEDDLKRRDLTINAMAQDVAGKIVDPYGGWRDLQGRWLRHVSPAFSEDPLRVLRVARFAAQLAPWGFRIAPETQLLMRDIVRSGELASLPPERLWQEITKALVCEQPSVFFYALRSCGALKALLGEIDALFGVPQTASHHPEIDCGIHTMMVIDAAATAHLPVAECFAALVHDLGKTITPSNLLPRHHGHENRGVPLVDALCARLRVAAKIHKLARACCAEHLHCHRALELRPATICDLVTRLDGWRKPDQVAAFIRVCTADARGRLGFADCDYPQAHYLARCHQAALGVSAARAITGIEDNAAKASAVRKARIAAIAGVSH